MNWTEFLNINRDLTSALALVSGILLGATLLLLWDSRIWLRKLISASSPRLVEFLLGVTEKEKLDHEYLVSKIMQSYDRRKVLSDRLYDKDRRMKLPTSKERANVS